MHAAIWRTFSLKILSVILVLRCCVAAFAWGAVDPFPEPGAHGHYAVLTAEWNSPPPFSSVDIVYGPREAVKGTLCLWWQMELKKEGQEQSLLILRALTSRDPLAESSEPIRFERYILRLPETGELLEYRDIHTSRALLPPWKRFEQHFVPHAARGSHRVEKLPETAALLGHTLTVQWRGHRVPWDNWRDVKRLDLDRELLIGTGRNFRDAELKRLPQTPQRQNYTYVPFTREEYRVMIDAGVNLFIVSPQQSEWIRSEPVFFLRGVSGKPALCYPADLYRSNYIGSVMFMDEPAIIMVGDKNVHNTLRYFSDAANLLKQRVQSRYHSAGHYGAFELEGEFEKAGVNFGAMRLEQWDYPAWETMYATAHYQLEADVAGIVHEGRYQLEGFDQAIAPWTAAPRKHTPEEMLRYHYAFLRGAARATGKHWGTSIYGQADPKHSPLAMTLAYDMGARYLWFWTSDHDHHMPWPEQLALARVLKEHAAKHPRKSIYSDRSMLDVAIAIPYGYFLELGNLWWIRAIDKEQKNEYAQRYARVMRRAHAAIQQAMDRQEDFDVIVDTGEPLRGYKRVERVGDTE